MEILTSKEIIIDLRKPSFVSTPQFIQQDSNIIEFTVLDNGVEADLESSVGKIVVNYKRPDGHTTTRLLYADGNKITYRIGQKEMEVSGEGQLELQFFSKTVVDRISSRIFKINLIKSIGSGSISEGDGDVTLLQQLMIEVTEVGSKASEQADYAQTQGDYAKEQALAANLATTNADLMAEKANNAAKEADLQAYNAENAMQEALRATTEADTQESLRKSAETEREAAETLRADQESTRQQNEQTRQSQETKRQSDTRQAVSDVGVLVSQTTFRGNYSEAIQYYKNNQVRYQKAVYIARKHTLGNLPTNTEFWQLFSVDGVDGKGAVSTVNNISPDQSGNVELDMSGYVTKEEAKNYAEKGDLTTVTTFKNTVVVSNSTSNVSIGIPEFNPATDSLMVIKNTATLAEGTNYKIGTNGTSIDSLEGVWIGTSYPITFHFIVSKNVVTEPTYGDGNMIQDETIGLNKLKPELQDKFETFGQAFVVSPTPPTSMNVIWFDTSE